MREFKFRAWDIETNNWVEGVDLVIHTSGRLLNIPEHVILMQWTGLTDKAGKDIYEGDIVEMFERSLFRVVWDEYYARYQLELAKGDELSKVHAPDQLQFAVIVGNIYETPDLLK